MTSQTSVRWISFAAISCLLLASCSEEKIDPTPVNKSLTLTAGSNVNRYNGQVNPVVIRLYQLSNRSEFESAGFWNIFNDTKALAGVVLDKRSLSPIYPGESRTVSIDLVKDAYYLGVFAEFADYEQQNYNVVAPINSSILDAGITVTVIASGVDIKNRRGVPPVVEQESSGFFKFLKKAVKFGGD